MPVTCVVLVSKSCNWKTAHRSPCVVWRGAHLVLDNQGMTHVQRRRRYLRQVKDMHASDSAACAGEEVKRKAPEYVRGEDNNNNNNNKQD